MAVTWEVKIDVLNLAEKRVRVTATRTENGDVFSYSLETHVDTASKPLAEIRAMIGDMTWAEYQAKATKEAAVATLLEGWEAALESDLMAKEA